MQLRTNAKNRLWPCPTPAFFKRAKNKPKNGPAQFGGFNNFFDLRKLGLTNNKRKKEEWGRTNKSINECEGIDWTNQSANMQASKRGNKITVTSDEQAQFAYRPSPYVRGKITTRGEGEITQYRCVKVGSEMVQSKGRWYIDVNAKRWRDQGTSECGIRQISEEV